MAQIDWTGITTSAPHNNYGTSVSGSAVAHNSITNAITSSGTWFRNFQSNTNGNNSIGGLLPVNNSLLTSSVGYPYGFTYSLRSWLRIDNSQDNTGRSASIAMTFKNKSNLSAQDFANAGPQAGNACKGYRLYLASANSTTSPFLTLRCANDINVQTHNSSLDAANNVNGYTINIISVPDATWIRARMDVMSLPSADRITIFSGSQSGNWTQLHQVDIPRDKVGAYIPWYNNPSYPSDNSAAATAGYMGILHYSNHIVTPVRIDGFEVYREAITI